MKNILNKFFNYIWQEAYSSNISNILSLLDYNPKVKVLDVGCGDGKESVKFKNKTGSKRIFGIDGVSERLDAAKTKGVDEIVHSDLEKKWPFQDNTFDIVVSNQVIEHVLDIDHYISEIHRILKAGGYCVISTENLSSWHNIFALSLGFQDFSHHIIKKSHISNPLSLHYGQKTCTWSAVDNSGIDDTAFPHVKILTYISLIKSFQVYNFKFEKGKGSGYYPLFGILSTLFSTVDPYHSHFITIKMRKEKQ